MDYFEYVEPNIVSGSAPAPSPEAALDPDNQVPPDRDLQDWLDQINLEEIYRTTPAWLIDAYQEFVELVLQDPEIQELVDRIEGQQLSPEVQRVVDNIIRSEVVENAQNGDYDEIVEKLETYSASSGAWSDANDFEDPYLDWYEDGANYFWRDDGPTWWGDEYGLY